MTRVEYSMSIDLKPFFTETEISGTPYMLYYPKLELAYVLSPDGALLFHPKVSQITN